MAKVDFAQEQATDQVLQRMQMNTARAFDQVQTGPSLVEEPGENGNPKAYGDQEYEVYHGLQSIVKGVSVAYCSGLVQIYSVDSNPENRDRLLFTRIRVVPMKINSTAIETDTTTRLLRFWME